MKKITLIVLVLIGVVSSEPALAATVNGSCQFDQGKQEFFCSADAEDQVPAGCVAQIVQTPASGMYCNKVPSGYKAPTILVTVSITPLTVTIGGTRPVISWQSPSVDSDKTTCSIKELGVQGMTASGNVTAPAATTAGSIPYTVTCQNSSASGTYSDSVTVCASDEEVKTTTNGRLGQSSTSCEKKAIPSSPATTAPAPTTPSPTTDGTLKYAPLEPLPGLKPGTTVSFATMLNLLFKVLISVGALFAVGTLVWGGIMYMVSDAFETKGEARRRMNAAIFGLLILAGSWLILHTINPQLLIFNLDVKSDPAASPNTSSPSGAAANNGARVDCEIVQGGNYVPQQDGSYKCIK